ncbi:MAG TPA: tetratricopeptide repeat protein, partial [Phototrophicaceae bacterium]|nr:tetratricopeptide repeat protein [Phototrophicaceae bacterium]
LAYIGLARAIQGKSGQAWIQQALTVEPENAIVHYLEGIYDRNQGKYDASIAAFTLALTYDSQNPAYYVELGNTHLEMGDLVGAEYWLRQAVTVSRNDPEFQGILDHFYSENAPLLAAAGVDAPQVQTANANIQADMGWTLYRTGALEEANQALTSALTLEPGNPHALFYQAKIALDQGDTEKAKTLLQQVVKAGKDFKQDAQDLLDGLDG